MTRDYVPANLAIEAMRDNGYRNTAYAVCELIDNSIQAGEKQEKINIYLMCSEKTEQRNTRTTSRISEIAVLDDGEGMSKDVLWVALQFGNGTRLNKKDRKGMGRFGMGLPASSISQARRVEIWTWQDGVENSLYTYLDIDEIKRNNNSEVPEPINKKIPEKWKLHGTYGKSGTLVVWSKLDRIMWTKSATLIDNSEELIGRAYRKFLHNGIVTIQMLYFDEDAPATVIEKRKARPNDPLYLMAETSCPAPFDKQAMFDPFGEQNETKFRILHQGEEHEIVVRFSMAKKEARDTANAGATSYGKHAARNVGISIVRANRELELDQSIVNTYDPRERWWGIEVDFPPALDELMGVTNNKQTARNFADVLNFDFEALAKEGKTVTQVMEELKEDGDPRAPLFEVIKHIRNQYRIMRELIQAQRVGTRGNGTERYSSDLSTLRHGTIATDERKQEGYAGGSDPDETQENEQRVQVIRETLEEYDVPSEEAKNLTATVIGNNLKYLFAETALETDAFFVVKPKGGVINILINTKHPAYEHLVEVVEKEIEDDVEELKERLNKAARGLKLLLMAWARYEDELPDGKLKETAQDTRKDWGRVARGFLRA